MQLLADPVARFLVTERRPDSDIPGLGVSLALDHVSHSYGSLQALRDVSFEMNPGEIVDRVPWRSVADRMAAVLADVGRAHLGAAASAGKKKTE